MERSLTLFLRKRVEAVKYLDNLKQFNNESWVLSLTPRVWFIHVSYLITLSKLDPKIC